MKVAGEIVLIDKDEFEKEFFSEIIERLNLSVKIKHFKKPDEGFDYLKKADSKIFVVISVVDFGRSDRQGLELKKRINADEGLLDRSIPFVFMSYLDDKETIKAAYKLNIQGYFKKPMSLDESTVFLSSLFKYWSLNLTPDEGK